jgi:hypothetical protein
LSRPNDQTAARVHAHPAARAVLALAVAAVWGPAQVREGTLKAGDPAPDFQLKIRGSSDWLRLSDFHGRKPVALVFGSFT